MILEKQLINYVPWNEQELKDKQQILTLLTTKEDLFIRDHTSYHFTASPWIINRKNTKVLMVFHNIYQSWSWCGGHADGEKDLLKVALREAKEETGISVTPYLNDIFAIDILPVSEHIKNQKRVKAHQHINITYICVADETDRLLICPDENSGVMWIDKRDVHAYVNESLMIPVYDKLMKKTDMLYKP